MLRLVRRIRYWLSRNRMDAELAEEMEHHRAMLRESGAKPSAMGNAALAREDARGVWVWPWLESAWQDTAHALRGMRREPGFTITALLALGSAIGINTSLFTIFNAVALRPWSVREPSQVVTVNRFAPGSGNDFAIAEYRYLAQHSQTFSGLIAMRNGERVKLEDQPMQMTYVSGNYFGVLGVDMERGRGFINQEDRAGAPLAVAVISHDLWITQFGADAQIVGRSIRLDEIPFTVVGVTPPDFNGTNTLRNDIWTPLPARQLLRPNDPSVKAWLTAPNYCCSPIAGRLAPAVTRKSAQAELVTLLDQFRMENRTDSVQTQIVLAGTSWIESPRKKRQVLPMMLLLFVAVTLVLLLACANVGNLLLARASARRQEIAVRLSLGSSRFRLVRQLLAESLLLAFGAAGLGLGLALVVPPVLMHQLDEDRALHLAPDVSVLCYTLAIAILSCLAFGLAPALYGTRERIASALQGAKARQNAFRTRLPLRNVLLSVQVAISAILLTNAGLVVHGMQRAQVLDPGFDVQNTTLLAIDLPASEYTGPRTKTLTLDLLAQLDRASGLPASGLAMNPPLGNANYSTSFQPANQQGPPVMHIYFNEISPGYIGALGMHLLAGRNFVAEDGGRTVMMINEAAAKRWWPNESPVGKTVLANNAEREIIGVISDTYSNDLSSIEAVLYFPISGTHGAPFVIVGDRHPASVDRVAALVKQIEPRAQVRSEPLSTSFQRKLEPSIHGTEIAGLLGLLALAIAAVEMFGVFAYVVSQRTREIGVRMALGAQPVQIIWLVLGSSFGALLSGLCCGMACAAGISAFLVHALPGIVPLDPLAYSSVVILLGVAVALASAVPARRATRVDPARALAWE